MLKGLESARMKPEDAEALVERIRPLLAGKPPPLQGAVLADLLAIWLAGHDASLRDELLKAHIESVRALIAPNVALINERLGIERP